MESEKENTLAPDGIPKEVLEGAQELITLQQSEKAIAESSVQMQKQQPPTKKQPSKEHEAEQSGVNNASGNKIRSKAFSRLIISPAPFLGIYIRLITLFLLLVA